MAFVNSNNLKIKIHSLSTAVPKLAGNSSLERNGIDQRKEGSLENGVYIDSPKKGLLSKDGNEEGAQSKAQTNGGDLGSRIEHMHLWNKGMEVLGASKEYAADIGRSLFHMKERLMYKLAAVPVPAEALDNARQSVETIIKDMTHAAQGLTKDAVQRIKSRLVEILPSLSPTQTEKIVDDAEIEVLDMSQGSATRDASRDERKLSSTESTKQENQREDASPSKSWFMSPASSFPINMGRLKRPFSPRSRL
ncbi:uncharacterized protein LOC131065235 [Cryptomeria japonica]|uniref:uncharacterized protein LOC131065235 n=1 Tax=Cryptomeria japonica TaxID=3369 RepID=UPI0025AD3D92|nr:uncharacterized protein LOC131065235 [Cryptomeria japonica]XP_057855676.1 uncharacterized protein LOC131065235 [Cryptomeria japonica]XP_057855677.1 uncharacterized protein LOC131065235 [Cryptomeria japonica]